MKNLLPLLLTATLPVHAASFLVEAEQFSDQGGWGVDTQFIESMGSPYLIAHGLGKPVANAQTEVSVPADGTYRVWTRTMDWTKRLGRPDSAGVFAISVNGKKIGAELGRNDTAWTWQLAEKPNSSPARQPSPFTTSLASTAVSMRCFSAVILHSPLRSSARLRSGPLGKFQVRPTRSNKPVISIWS